MPLPQDDSFAPQPDTERQILDNPKEVFDLVDSDDRVIGQVLRGEAHRNPALIHRSVQILVFTSDGRLLLQRRSMSKDLFPGYFCASASGHVATGEDYTVTAERELIEELGVSASLTFIGKALIQSEPETEITALYVAHSDGPFHFHPTETAGGLLLTMGEVHSSRVNGTLPMTPALLAGLDELLRHIEQGAEDFTAFIAKLG